MSSPGRQLKALLRAPKILIAPGIYDGYSARLVEQLGFKSGSISGAGTSESRMGWADRGVMGHRDRIVDPVERHGFHAEDRASHAERG